MGEYSYYNCGKQWLNRYRVEEDGGRYLVRKISSWSVPFLSGKYPFDTYLGKFTTMEEVFAFIKSDAGSKVVKLAEDDARQET